MKESFVIFKSFYEPIKHLSDEDLGKLFRALFEFQIEEKEEIVPSIKMAFEFFKNQFRLDNEKYKKRVEANRVNGLKGGRNPKEPKKPNGLNGNPKNPSEANKAEKDNVKENDKDKETAKGVIDYLNLKAKKKFKHTEANIKSILARGSEGCSVEDMHYVIDVKCTEWLNTDMEKHLNPVTLFRPANFDKYLNQKTFNSVPSDEELSASFDAQIGITS